MCIGGFFHTHFKHEEAFLQYLSSLRVHRSHLLIPFYLIQTLFLCFPDSFIWLQTAESSIQSTRLAAGFEFKPTWIALTNLEGAIKLIPDPPWPFSCCLSNWSLHRQSPLNVKRMCVCFHSIHNAVISVFQRKDLGENELYSLNEGVRLAVSFLINLVQICSSLLQQHTIYWSFLGEIGLNCSVLRVIFHLLPLKLNTYTHSDSFI